MQPQLGKLLTAKKREFRLSDPSRFEMDKMVNQEVLI
jgi:hypothetical protein